MALYGRFAYVYDKLMDDVDYKAWCDYIISIFEYFGVRPGLIADLACGTGSLCVEMAKRGYEMIGIDRSEDMLAVADEKCRRENQNVLLLHQDMTEFELYGTVDAFLCTMDSINYILDKRKLKKLFKLVHNYLNPGGLLVFDINSVHKLSRTIGNNTFTDVRDDVAYIWYNYYDKKTRICSFDLTFFLKKEDSPLYERFEEFHQERAYSVEELVPLLEECRLKVKSIWKEFSFDNADENKDERLFFVCMKEA